MKNVLQTFNYSIGKKLLMGLTGLFLIVFLTEHLIGNSLMLLGPEPFNAYAHFMGTTLIVRIAEVGLFALFLLHIVNGLRLAMQNKKARPVKYAVNAGKANSSWFSRNMATTGTILLIFLIVHLVTFWFKARLGIDITLGLDPATYEGAGVQGLAEGETFSMWHKAAAMMSMPWYSGLYLLTMPIVGFHLFHGFQSAFQTFGWNHRKYTPLIKFLGNAYAILIPLAFMVIPVYFLVMKFTGGIDIYFH